MSGGDDSGGHREILVQAGTVYAGTAARAALALGINLLVARWLGPERYGIYSLFVATAAIFFSAFGDAFNAGLVRYYAFFAERDQGRAAGVIGNSIALRLAIAVPLTGAGIAASGWLGRSVLEQPGAGWALRMGVMAAFLHGFTTFALSILQARAQFVLRSVIFPLANVVLILLLPLLLLGGWLSLRPLLWANLLSAAVAAGVGLWLVRDELRRARVDRAGLRALFGFTRWSAASHFIFMVSVSLSVPVLTRVHGAAAAGIFAAGASLVLVVEMVAAAIMTVQLPTMSRLAESAALRAYLRRSFASYLGVALLCSPLFVLARGIVELVYGPDYAASAAVVQLLLVGALVSLMTHPLAQVFYAVNRPELSVLVSAVSTLAWIGAAMFLIPPYAAFGTAATMVVSRAVSAVMIVALVAKVLARTEPVV